MACLRGRSNGLVFYVKDPNLRLRIFHIVEADIGWEGASNGGYIHDET